MFFDRKNQTQDSHSSLMKITKLQYELYIQGIREPSPQLERERTALSLKEKENHVIQSICWWNLSWPQVFDELKNDTTFPKGTDRDGWEWEYTLDCKEKGQNCLILLKEHGRKVGKASIEHEWINFEESKYSRAERQQMVDDYNKRIDQWELFGLLTTEGPVYSGVHNKTYDSMGDYLLSADHLLMRNLCADLYADSLYTMHTVHNMQVRSNTMHCRKAYAVGELHFDRSGFIDMIRPLDFEIVAAQGYDVKCGLLDEFPRDSLFCCMKYIAEHQLKSRISIEFLKEKMNEKSGTYESAMKMAKMITYMIGMLE